MRISRKRGLRRGLPVSAMILALTVGATACTGGGSNNDANSTGSSDGQIVVSLDTDVNLIEPQTFRTLAAFAATGALYAPLLRQDFTAENGMLVGDSKFSPGIASSYDISRDGKRVTLHLRKDAKFADGSPITADDVVYTFQRALLGPGYVKALLPFIGITQEDQIKAVDASTVELTPSVASPLLERFLTFQVLGIMEKKVAEEHKTADDPWAVQWFNDNATPSGPYEVQDYERDRQLVLAPNPNYYDAASLPNNGITMRYVADADQRALLLQGGQIDLATGLTPKLLNKLDGDPNVTVYQSPSSRLTYLGMNNTVKPFDNVKVRQAISYAIPYQELIDKVMYGYAQPAGNVVTSPMDTYAGDQVGTYNTDLAKAKSLLQEAGVGPITVDLAVRQTRLDDQQAAVFIQSNLRQIGVTVNIDKLPDAEYSDKLNNKQLPMFIHDWYSWGEDPFYQMSFLVKSDAFTDYTAYKNPELDKLIKEGTFETDPAKRAEISKEAQAILFKDAPMAYLYSPDWTVAARSNIQGVAQDFTQIVRFDQLSKK